ncbi:MAG: alpha-mannosidase, partial [Actinomycetes bacterium]
TRMMAQYHRAKNLEGSPRLSIEPPSAFFDKAIAEYPEAPRWVGELYFEMHRGTFTSQAATKAGNRRCESLLREAETFVVAAHGTQAASTEVLTELDELWKDVLLHQFHDILPGSSIGWVHREAADTYARVAEALERVIAAAVAVIRPNRTTTGAWINPAPVPFRGVVEAPTSATGGADPEPRWMDVGALSVADTLPNLPSDVTPVTTTRSGDCIVVDNGLIRLTLDASGHISSLIDLRTGRDAIAPGQVGGVLQLHPDLPIEYDAWDIEDFDVRRPTPIDEVDQIVVERSDEFIARVRVERSAAPSTFVQTYVVTAGSARLDVRCTADWRHRERLLKVAFPLDLHTDSVTREIQFGQLRTPIHINTSWDVARFEFCAHRWVHAAEPGFGVSVLNDCKYGYDAQRTRSTHPDGSTQPSTTIRLSLLKAAIWPDPQQDQGAHEFTYALLVGDGRLDDGVVVAEGYRLNQPPRLVQVPTLDPAPDGAEISGPIVSCDTPTVIVEAVKPADDGSGDIVVRCYEATGGRSSATLVVGVPVSEMQRTDARERPLADSNATPVLDGQVHLELRPFEIATLRLTRQPDTGGS